MTIWTTTRDAANTVLYSVPKARMTTVVISARGLLTNSTYSFWCNGVDMTWACRTPGTKMGSPLVSDASGSMKILFSVEIHPYTSISTDPSATTKYHSMYLKDIHGNVKSLSIVPQFLNPK